MNLKKVLPIILSAAALVSAASGCGGKKVSENVTLKYLMPGPGLQQDSEKVWAEFNKKLQEKLPNVRVEFEVVPLEEYKQKFMLMTSAREQIDIVNNYGLDFANEVKNGTFTPIDDLMGEYGKELTQALPDWFMDYQKVDGITYGIPTYQMCAYLRGICFFKEQADKYLDTDAFKKALYSTDTFNQEVYDILTKYIEDMKADGLNFNNATILNVKSGGESMTTYFNAVDDGNGNYTVQPYFINDSAKLRYKVANEWYKKGYIRQDVLSATNMNEDKGKLNGYPFWDEVYTPFAAEELSKKYGNEIVMIPYSETWTLAKENTAAGTSIMESCEHKEEAMKVINLLQTDKDLYNLLVFGIEGDHYKKTGDDQIQVEWDSSPSTNDRYGLYKWIVGNTEIAYNTQNEPPEYKDWVFNDVNKNGKKNPFMGFLLDTTQIQDYLTQVAAVQEKYLQPLNSGATDNWEEYYKKYEDETNKVGGGKAIEAIQQQIDDFMRKKN